MVNHGEPSIFSHFSGSKRIKHAKEIKTTVTVAVQAHVHLHVNARMHNVKTMGPWVYLCSFKDFQELRQPETHGYDYEEPVEFLIIKYPPIVWRLEEPDFETSYGVV